MKTLFNLSLGVILLIFTATCSNSNGNTIEVSGVIQEQGMTSYQYGSHTLSNGDQFFALRSESVDLDQYVDKEVRVRAEKIEGYPVDGGPEFLMVLEVIE